MLNMKDDIEYNAETGIFTWLKGRCRGNRAGYKKRDGYRYIQYKNITRSEHVWAFIWMGKGIPDQIDHKNLIKDDNRWCNLRESNNSLNQVNTNLSSRNTSGYRGVYWKKDKQKWCAQLNWRENNRRRSKHLGYFDCPKTARDAYKKAAIERYGADWVR